MERSDLLWVDIPTINLRVSPSGFVPSSETYFDCTAVPGDNFEGRARAEQPCDVSLGALDRALCRCGKDSERCHNSSEDLMRNASALDHSPWSDGERVRPS